MKTELIAKICHQANKAYCESINDFSQASWEQTSKELQASAINGVEKALEEPGISAEDMHDNWVEFKVAAGWKHGELKSEHAKTHPCMVEFDDLPEAQQVKDTLFSSIVNIMGGLDNDDSA